MCHKLKLFLGIFLLINLLVLPTQAQLTVGQVPPVIDFDGKNGSTVEGGVWNSKTLPVDKIISFMYVDPDAKDWNLELEKALKQAEFPKDKFFSVGTINMKATWLPNFAINSSLKEKQKLYPDTLYLQDLKKVLVKEWGLEDDSYHVLILSKKGEVLYSKAGKLSTTDVQDVLKTIRDYI